MNRLGVLLGTGLVVGSVLVGPGSPPTVAAETCRGETATLTGPGTDGDLVGTAGDDVVVTNGATAVETLGGDDLICVTGAALGVDVDAGEGDDLVYAYNDDPFVERGRGARAEPGVVAVDLGAGDDLAFLAVDDTGRGKGGDTDAAADQYTLDGGGGTDRLRVESWFQEDQRSGLAGRVAIRVREGYGAAGLSVELGFEGFESYRADGQGGVYLIGDDGPNELMGFGCATMQVYANGGSDRIVALPPLSDDRFFCDADDDLRVRLHGNSHGDEIITHVAAKVRGGGGADVIDARPSCGSYVARRSCGLTVIAEEGNDTIYGSPGRGGVAADVLNGGPGNDTVYGLGGPDRLYGYDGNDRLYGGTGPDTVYGGAGRDLCRGESVRGCERR